MIRGRVWALCGLLAMVGCAGHATTMQDVRAALLKNDLEQARARLAEAGRGTDDLLFALEDGLLLHVAGDPSLSNSRLEFAEQRIDDLYTKSISRAALSLVASDLVLKFEPRGIENFLINYYRALNYLQLGLEQEAWVEWRKLASKLQFSREQGDAEYLDPAFFNYVAGLGLESDQPNDAYISLRLAEAAYRGRGDAPPPELIEDLFRLATQLGFADHLEVYRSRYGGVDSRRGEVRDAAIVESSYQEAPGEIVVLIEDGLVAPLLEIQAFIPITRERDGIAQSSNGGAQLILAESLAREYHAGTYAGVGRRHSRRREIAYVLPLSFPVFGVGETNVNRLSAVAGGYSVSARALLPLSSLQRAAFEDRLLGIYAKTIARALVKYAAAQQLKKKAEKEGGKTAGTVVNVVANVLNIVTERADTRAWLGLPHRIWIARLSVPAGRHELRLLIDGRDTVELGVVDVEPGERRIISSRVY